MAHPARGIRPIRVTTPSGSVFNPLCRFDSLNAQGSGLSVFAIRSLLELPSGQGVGTGVSGRDSDGQPIVLKPNGDLVSTGARGGQQVKDGAALARRPGCSFPFPPVPPQEAPMAAAPAPCGESLADMIRAPDCGPARCTAPTAGAACRW